MYIRIVQVPSLKCINKQITESINDSVFFQTTEILNYYSVELLYLYKFDLRFESEKICDYKCFHCTVNE